VVDALSELATCAHAWLWLPEVAVAVAVAVALAACSGGGGGDLALVLDRVWWRLRVAVPSVTEDIALSSLAPDTADPLGSTGAADSAYTMKV
jgi:hypothetical protein